MNQASVWITIDRFEGSSPREVGAWMLVTKNTVEGTVGGGHLEFDAIAKAREWLSASVQTAQTAQSADVQTLRYALGPALGQCCGGVVWLRLEYIAPEDTTKLIALRAYFMPATGPKVLKIALFGGGHVGKAIVRVMSGLPAQIHWIDSRDEIFPDDLPVNVQAEHSAPVQAAVRDLASGSHVLIMSFSHAEDLDVLAACLKRQREKGDLPFIGLIGSKTKWATFRHRLEERGFTPDELALVTCPIGLPSVPGKEPEVIAVSVAAQLLALRLLK
jgi:xanthine dehydrogenase accessory factor